MPDKDPRAARMEGMKPPIPLPTTPQNALTDSLQGLIQYLQQQAPAAPDLKALLGSVVPKPRGQSLEDLMLP